MSEPRAIGSRRIRQALASIRRFFDTGNLLRFLVSMVLAFGLWAWVTYENDPETTRVVGGVAVAVENLHSDVEIVGEPPTVDVTIQGPQSLVTPLEREAVIASVDMDDVDEPGEHDLDVKIEIPSDMRIRDVAPDTVTIEIDRMSSREDIPVTILDPDDVPENYQIETIDLDPDSIDVAGPERTLQQIDRAEVQVQIDGRTSSFTDEIVPVLIDENREELSGIQVEPEEVTVTVSLDVRGQVRKVIPLIVGDDALAPGHELVRTTVLPVDDVVVDGPEEDLANVFFITTEPVDVTGWDESQIVRDVELDRSRLPGDVTLELDSVHVSIEIRQQTHQRELRDLPISVMNVSEGTSVELDDETASVILEGSRTEVESVAPEDITVFINVGNASPGDYELELRVIVPAQVQYREIEPASVSVQVEPADEELTSDLVRIPAS